MGIVNTQSELDQRSAYLALGDAADCFVAAMAWTASTCGCRICSTRRRSVARPSPLWVGQVYAITWMRMHGNLYRAIEFQRAMMFLLLSLLVGVAAFNLVSALIMVVNQRRGDVAVLRTLGGGTAP